MSDQTQSSVSAVKSRLPRGRKSLAEILGDDSFAGTDDDGPEQRTTLRSAFPAPEAEARRGLQQNEVA